LAATVYMSLLGKHGMRQVAELNYHKAHYAAEKISAIAGFRLWSPEPFFNEFVIECPLPAADLNEHLLENNILGGYPLGTDYLGMEKFSLLAVTEMNSKDDIDFLAETLTEVANG